MKKICAVFALFCAMILLVGCDNGSKKVTYNDADDVDSTSETNDSDDSGNTNSDDADSQSDSTADTTPDNGDSSDDSYSDKPDSDNPDTTTDNGDSTDDGSISDSTDSGNDSGDLQADDDSDTSSDEDSQPTTKVTECTGLPENGEWNYVSAISQSWNGTERVPSETSSYNEEKSNSECRFVCKTNYSWNGTACLPDEKNAECTGKPENAVWNNVSNITQTWDGSDWIPTNSAIFSETPSSSKCWLSQLLSVNSAPPFQQRSLNS